MPQHKEKIVSILLAQATSKVNFCDVSIYCFPYKKKFPLASGFQINFNDFLKICGQLFARNACKTYFYEKTSAVNLGNV